MHPRGYMRVLISRIWPLLYLLGVTVVLLIAKLIGVDELEGMSKFLPTAAAAVSATVFFALWKLEEDLRKTKDEITKKIDQQTVTLKGEIDESDALLHRLFSAFRMQLGDEQF